MYFSSYQFCYRLNDQKESHNLLTPVLVAEDNSDGTISIKQSFVERFVSPLSGLSFSDFSLSSLIKNGISPKALVLTHDVRLGFDSEIDSFNSHLEEIASDLFDSKE